MLAPLTASISAWISKLWGRGSRRWFSVVLPQAVIVRKRSEGSILF